MAEISSGNALCQTVAFTTTVFTMTDAQLLNEITSANSKEHNARTVLFYKPTDCKVS